MPERKNTKKKPFLDLGPKDSTPKDKKTRNFTFLYFIMAFLAIIVINNYLSTSEVKPIPYSEFKQELKKGKVSDLTVGSETIQGTMTQDDGKATKFTTARVEDTQLVTEHHEKGVRYAGQVENNFLKASSRGYCPSSSSSSSITFSCAGWAALHRACSASASAAARYSA
jgi:cell division protease FtsH